MNVTQVHLEGYLDFWLVEWSFSKYVQYSDIVCWCSHTINRCCHTCLTHSYLLSTNL